MTRPQNQVLTDDACTSSNFFESDQILQNYLNKYCKDDSWKYMHDKLEQLGEKAANEMDALSLTADQNGPELKKRSKFGEDISHVEFHPAYQKLVDIAAESEMFYVKYNDKLRSKLSDDRQKLCFAAGQLYAMSELGVYCPLCMTDGAAHLIDQHASDDIKKRLLPKLSARNGENLFTGAMFLTEKSGGSDVGRNLTTAQKIKGDSYKLNGEKWFCSNVNADVIMALARTGTIEEGTGGLSLFLVEKTLADGSRNQKNIIRLKDKMGVRSMATGEVELNDTEGILLGQEGQGFKLMTQMINISRTYNAVAAIAGCRRAIIDAWEYLSYRITFGKAAVEHALIRQKFFELGSKYIADFFLTWRAIRAMDAAENGDNSEHELMRILVPMAKWKTAEQSVYSVRECMELMGGNGYIEGCVMPKILRDVNVLPIWEGSGNIIVLDILRAAQKSKGLKMVVNQIREAAGQSNKYGDLINDQLNKCLSVWKRLADEENRDIIESTAKPLFAKLIKIYQMALMIEENNEQSVPRINLALEYVASSYKDKMSTKSAPSLEKVRELLGWNFRQAKK